MKRIVALLLILMTVAGTVLGTGCGIVTRGSDYCYRFLDYICNSEFDKAYEMIADSVKAPETEEERAKRLEAEQKAKDEKKKFWKEVFGFTDEEAESTPTPVPTDTPAPEGTPAPVATDPVMQNGATPNPETGEYPVVDATPTPDPNATPTPEATETPEPTPETTETPEPTARVSTDMDLDGDGYVAIPGIETPTPVPSATPAPTGTPDPRATPDPNATPTPAPTPGVGEDGEEEIDKTITRVGFIQKYQSIFDELMLTGIEYKASDVTDGEILAIVDYTLTYHSARAGGDLTYDFQIRANRVEHRWCIEWSPSLIFPMMQWGDNLRVGVLQANRGEILCGGEAYAQNVNIITIFAVPSVIPDLDQFCIDVAAIPEMETTEETVREAIEKQRNNFAKLKTFFPDEIDLALSERILAVKGLSIDTANYGTQRFYPYGTSLCHIVGYAGIISKKEKLNYEQYGDITYNEAEKRFESAGTTRYNGDSWIGKYGLELLYEDRLLGTNGRFTYIQDTKGGSRGMLYSEKAVDGEDLHLTIIPELQERLEDVVETVVYDEKIHGSVVVLNPKTGAIQAMTSWPGFDLNYLARGMPVEEWEALQNDPTIPLYNRATQGLYTPGSVFKLMTSAALLETQTMSPNDVFPEGSEPITDDWWIPSNAFMASVSSETLGEHRSDLADEPFKVQSDGHPIARVRSDSNPGPMNLSNSICWSDNIFFAYSALRMGAKKFENYMINKLEWNTPIQLEAEGTRPRIYWRADASDPEGARWQRLAEGGEVIWEQNEQGVWVPSEDKSGLVLDKNPIYGMDVSVPQLYSTEMPQSDYDLAVTGYGQGQIMMSPLHMACYASAYANDGVIMQPYLVDSIWHADGTDYSLVEQRHPKVYKRLLEQSTVDTIYPSLVNVCHLGTGRWMFNNYFKKGYTYSPGYELAGKTGTAEITDNKTKELAWFICWRDSDSATGEKVTEENARLVCIMLEIDMTKQAAEWEQMKYDIARSMLKKSILNNDETETA